MIRKVAVGLSGGIDSAMSALLLMEAGYEVIGLTMSFYDPASGINVASGKGCFGPNEALNILAARRVAEALGIEHHVIDLRTEFAGQVLDYYRSTYLAGQTPNPCAKCNAFIKFGLLPQKARDLGIEFDLFATGHYVRRVQNPDTSRWQLFRGVDLSKDQSYFLSLLRQEQLADTLFPLGEFSKSGVKEMAAQRGLDFLLGKAESQDFIQSDDHAGLFDPALVKPGDLVDQEAKVLARHRGLVHYTIGQRKGLGISGMAEPVFVTRIDAERNQVVIGPASQLYKKELIARDFNWLSVSASQLPARAQAKIRQQHKAADCDLIPLGKNLLKLVFDEPQLSITPGQIVAVYQGDLLLGGGFIAAGRS